jgi:hypothetical protein
MTDTVLDYDDAVPPALIARWSAPDTDALVLVDLVAFLGEAAAVIVAVGAAGAGLAGAVPVAHGLVGVVGGALLAAALAVGRRLLGRRTGIRPKDIDLVFDHRVEITLTDWDVEPEARIAQRAARIGAAVSGSAAWHDPELRAAGLRLDVPEEVRQLTVAARRLYELRLDLGPRPECEIGRPDWEAVHDQWGATLQTLAERVAALADYRDRLEQWGAATAARRRGEHLRGLFDTAAQTLPAATVRSELATEQLAALTARLEADL